MKFGWTIIYVSDVQASLKFFEQAFGFKTKFVQENLYGELETGETVLAFASHSMGRANLPGGYIPVDQDPAQPVGMKISFMVENMDQAYAQAVNAGAFPLQAPIQKPWGLVSYLRCPDGVLVELFVPAS